MSLVGEFELSLHVVESMWILLNAIFTLIFLISFALSFWRLDLLEKVVMAREQFLGVDFANLTEWNIWDFMFETTVNIDVIVGGPA